MAPGARGAPTPAPAEAAGAGEPVAQSACTSPAEPPLPLNKGSISRPFRGPFFSLPAPALSPGPGKAEDWRSPGGSAGSELEAPGRRGNPLPTCGCGFLRTERAIRGSWSAALETDTCSLQIEAGCELFAPLAGTQRNSLAPGPHRPGWGLGAAGSASRVRATGEPGARPLRAGAGAGLKPRLAREAPAAAGPAPRPPAPGPHRPPRAVTGSRRPAAGLWVVGAKPAGGRPAPPRNRRAQPPRPGRRGGGAVAVAACEAVNPPRPRPPSSSFLSAPSPPLPSQSRARVNVARRRGTQPRPLPRPRRLVRTPGRRPPPAPALPQGAAAAGGEERGGEPRDGGGKGAGGSRRLED